LTIYLVPTANTPVGITSVSATSLAAGALPTVTNTGTSTAASLVFGIPAGATGAPGTGTAAADHVAIVAAVRSYSGASNVLIVDGYHAAADGGGGTFIWVSGSSAGDDGGITLVPTGRSGGRWIRLMSNSIVSPLWFGAYADNTHFDNVAINAAAAWCIANGGTLDLSGGNGWRINARLIFTGLESVWCSYGASINVDVTGTYTNHYAIEFGDPAQSWTGGRSVGTTIAGELVLYTSTFRGSAVSGVYMKGSWFNVGHIRTYGFNGTGVHMQSIFDSTINRISVESCGNATTYAFIIDSPDDNSNTTHINSVQCETCFQKGMYFSIFNFVIDNIHSENIAIISTSDGTPTYGYLNHYFYLENSSVNQAIIWCSLDKYAADGTTPVVSNAMNVEISGMNSSFNDWQTTFSTSTCNIYDIVGSGNTIRNLNATNYKVVNNVTNDYLLLNCQIIGVCAISSGYQLINCQIGTFTPTQPSIMNVTVQGGSVNTVTFPGIYSRGISFYNVIIETVGDTNHPLTGYKPVSFVDCNITTFKGALYGQATMLGGYVQTCSLVDGSYANFQDVTFGSFTYAGVAAFLTRNWDDYRAAWL
jgi:hypothetical protein